MKKVILFAHSMGTIITRNLLQTESAGYEKVILSGFPYNPGVLATGTGIFLCNVVSAAKGQKYYSKFIQTLGVGSFIKAVENPKTELDWISFNEENIQKYLADPYCGHGFKVSAYRDLFHLLQNMDKLGNYRSVNSNLPLLLIWGEGDPCTGFEKGTSASIHVLKKAGFRNIRTKAYPNMRHEILNEEGREQVMADIVKFMGS